MKTYQVVVFMAFLLVAYHSSYLLLKLKVKNLKKGKSTSACGQTWICKPIKTLGIRTRLGTKGYQRI